MPGAFNPLPAPNLPDTINLIIDPNNLQSVDINTSSFNITTTPSPSNRQTGGKKQNTKQNTKQNKYDLINHYKKEELLKLANYFNIKVQNKDGSKKNKEEIFKILYKKKIV